jgi:hypothetical protein
MRSGTDGIGGLIPAPTCRADLPAELRQHCLQFKERAQQFVRMNDLAPAVVFMRINDPTPAVVCNGAAIAPRPAWGAELVSNRFLVFHWRHDSRVS